MAAGGKASKSGRKYKVKGVKNVDKKQSSSSQGSTDETDISESEGSALDKRILTGAIIANVGILTVALAFWVLYAICGSGFSGVVGALTGHAAASSVTPTSIPTPHPQIGSGANEVVGPATGHATASSATPASTTASPHPPVGSNTGGGEGPADVDVTSHLTFECGIPVTQPDLKKGRIVGGAEAVPYSWPYTAGLGFVKVMPWNGALSIKQICGATLLGPKHALSAVHCFGNDMEIKQVYNVFAQYHHQLTYEGVVTSRVVKVNFHPLHNIGKSTVYQYDFAMLTLLNEFKPGPKLQFACLPPRRVEKPAGTICWAVGWGRTMGTGGDRLLKQVALDVTSEASCQFKNSYKIFKESTMCAGTTVGQDTCTGDSGGPLYCLDDGKWTVYGVTSFGPTDCGSGIMAGYGAVSFNIDWICCFVPNIPSCVGITCSPGGENRM